jgi:hypothetical protein
MHAVIHTNAPKVHACMQFASVRQYCLSVIPRKGHNVTFRPMNSIFFNLLGLFVHLFWHGFLVSPLLTGNPNCMHACSLCMWAGPNISKNLVNITYIPLNITYLGLFVRLVLRLDYFLLLAISAGTSYCWVSMQACWLSLQVLLELIIVS